MPRSGSHLVDARDNRSEQFGQVLSGESADRDDPCSDEFLPNHLKHVRKPLRIDQIGLVGADYDFPVCTDLSEDFIHRRAATRNGRSCFARVYEQQDHVRVCDFAECGRECLHDRGMHVFYEAN